MTTPNLEAERDRAIDRTVGRAYLHANGRFHCIPAAEPSTRLTAIALECIAKLLRKPDDGWIAMDCGTLAEHARICIDVERIAAAIGFGLEGIRANLMDGSGTLEVKRGALDVAGEDEPT